MQSCKRDPVWIDPKEHNLDGELSISLTGSDSGENILLEKIGVSDLEKPVG
jgi:hypothetical protein